MFMLIMLSCSHALSFSLSLSLSLSLSPLLSLSFPLSPLSTSIIDIVFGFELPEYTFSESVGMGIVAVTLNAESGELSENVVFTLSTQDGSAIGI